MSFHNRLLLNRLAVNGSDTVQVMMAIRPGRLQDALGHVVRLGGQVQRAEADVDYVRAEVPIDRVVELGSLSDIEAYQLASLAAPTWYASAHSQSRAEVERSVEVSPVTRATTQLRSDLPELSPNDARGDGYTANEDAGVGRWYTEHPTFDGRGITIAFLETALVEFGHPVLQVAKTLDGVHVPKVVGILNTLNPDGPDDTRVNLDTAIRATRAWHLVGHRTYVLPRPGAYRLGLFTLPIADELTQSFAVIRDEETDDVWVDTDGDADFRDERPLTDANLSIDIRYLRVTHPRRVDLGFVLTRGRTRDQVHLYTARSGHHTMSLSVATANATEDSLATGVAPGARVLVVRYTSGAPQFHAMIEGYLATARREDVDILCDSTGLVTVPDTAGEFASIFFRRLVAKYRKPIFHSAGNEAQFLKNVSAPGDVFSVGGALGPATFANLYGAGVLPRTVVHPSSAAGPTLDGAVKPDFLAPENRISAGVWVDDGYIPLPKNDPTKHLPAGYELSCCTSASSPYAAGVAALLLSAAKQTGVRYSVQSLGRALRTSARFLQDWPAHKQGNGVLDVNAAWRELQRPSAVPQIVTTSTMAHSLSPYVARGARGAGIFEQHGWSPGSRGRRILNFRRESGSARPIRYRLSWTGNDGTFSSAPRITLPRDIDVALPVGIDARTSGVHSAILNLHDPLTDAMVHRTQATIVVAESFDPSTGTAQFDGQVPLMHGREHFVQLPEGVSAMSVEMEIYEGALSATLLSPDGLYRSYFDHVQPLRGRTFAKGRYRFLWPSPAAGSWSINLQNTSASRERDPALVSTGTARYTITMRPFGASMDLRHTEAGGVEASFTNRFSRIDEPILEVSRATARSAEASTPITGLPSLFEIDVAAGSSALRVNLRAKSSNERTLELYLYDCTSGECFLWDFTFPAVNRHTMVVRGPTPGRWLAAVNAAPSPTSEVQFVFDEIVASATTPVNTANVTSKGVGESWTERLSVEQTASGDAGYQNGLLFELFDAAAARDARTYPWENRQGLFGLADRPAAVAAGWWRFN